MGPGDAGTELVEGVPVPFLSSGGWTYVSNLRPTMGNNSIMDRTINYAAIAPVSGLVLLGCALLQLEALLLAILLRVRNLDRGFIVTPKGG